MANQITAMREATERAMNAMRLFYDGPAEEVPDPLLPDPSRDTPGLARNDHRATSHAAAQSVWPKTGTARFEVLAAIARHSGVGVHTTGLTDEQIMHITGLSPNTARPRRVELERDGWIIDSGRTRPTASGSEAVVWELSGRGRMEWARQVAQP